MRSHRMCLTASLIWFLALLLPCVASKIESPVCQSLDFIDEAHADLQSQSLFPLQPPPENGKKLGYRGKHCAVKFSRLILNGFPC